MTPLSKLVRNWKLRRWAKQEAKKPSPYKYPGDTFAGAMERLDRIDERIERINAPMRARRN